MKYKYLSGKILFFLLVTHFVTGSGYGQEINTLDSINVIQNNPISLPSVYPITTIDPTPVENYNNDEVEYATPDYNFKPGYYPDFNPDRSPLHKGDYHVGGIIMNFGNNMVYGSGRQEYIPGIGNINHMNMGYYHVFDERFTMNIQAHALKTNIPYFRGQSFGTSGIFSYQINDHVTLNAFGSYFYNPSYPYNTNQYGSSMNFRITDRFRTEVGIRRSYDPMQNKWETIPVFTPTYRIKKVDIGVDVGSIIHYLLLKR